MKFFRVFLAITLSLTFTTLISAQKVRTSGNPGAAAWADRVDTKDKDAPEVSKTGRGKTEVEEPATNELITATTYSFLSTTGVLEDMSSGTTQIIAASQDDTASAVTNIGFEFWFDGLRYTQFSVNANGLMGFGAVVVNNGATGRTNDFATTTNNPKVSAYWDDLCTSATGRVHYKVVGSAPNRRLVVEFQNMRTYSAGCVAGTLLAPYQVWINESASASAPGAVQFVYGAIPVNPNVNGGYSIGLGSSSTSFASVTTSTNSVSYAASSNANVAAIAAGNSYVFTPNVPIAPTPSGVTGATPTGLTLNWLDNASNEAGYVVYRSLDNINFTYLNQTAANAVSFADSGLTPSTNYFYRVYAVTEGALSTAASFSTATTAPGSVSCVGAGGPWSAPGTWGGTLPTAGDNVTITTGCTVTIDTAAVGYNLTILNNGIVTFDAAAVSTGTFGGDVTINAGGTLATTFTGSVTTHNFTVNGNLTNNGTLDFSTNGNIAGATLTFGPGSSNVTFGGSGAINDVRAITLNKGALTTVVELTQNSFTVQGVVGDVAGYLNLTSGTFKISGTFVMNNRTFPSATYIIPVAGGIWLNNANYSIPGQAGGVTTANNGLLRMSAGTYNIGLLGADGMGGGTGAQFIIEGGTMNVVRLDPQNAVSFNMSGGTINVSPTAANNRSNFGSFEFFSAASTFTMSGGTINLIQASVGATPIDLQILSTPTTILGGVVNIGTGATATNFNFRVRSNLPNVVIDNTTTPKTATMTGTAAVTSVGTTTINAGSTLVGAAIPWVITGPSVVNNGTITMATAGGRMYFLGAAPQNYSGSGTTTIVTGSGSVDLTMDNPAGLTIAPGSGPFITQRVNFFRGGITNANELTLGNGGTTVGVLQYGLAASVNTAGSFDVAPVFNIGSGGQILLYAQEGTGRTTGVEIIPSRAVNSMTAGSTNGLTIAGGDLTVTAALTLTAGTVVTGNNVLINAGTAATRTTGYVDGNLRRPFAAAGTYTFMVGQGFYSPVAVNVTAVPAPSSLTVRAFDNTLSGFVVGQSISRNWSLEEIGDLTADLTFTYDNSDVNGDESDYRVYSRSGAGLGAIVTNHCMGGPCVNTATNSSTGITGISSFSRWTMAEALTPTAASVDVSGRVLTADGRPIRNVEVMITGEGLSQPMFVYTGNLGYYNFTELPVGSYVLTVNSKRFSFANQVRLIELSDNLFDQDFVAEPIQD